MTKEGKFAIVGRVEYLRYDGPIYRNAGQKPPGDNAHQGWGSSDSDRNFRNGEGGDWQTALDTHVNLEMCTVGWETWVDGNLACGADGNRLL